MAVKAKQLEWERSSAFNFATITNYEPKSKNLYFEIEDTIYCNFRAKFCAGDYATDDIVIRDLGLFFTLDEAKTACQSHFEQWWSGLGDEMIERKQNTEGNKRQLKCFNCLKHLLGPDKFCYRCGGKLKMEELV